MDKAEQPTIGQAQYLAMRCDNMPTDCVNFGVVDTLLGKEICRVWDEEDCRMIADLLNAPPIPDRTTSLATQDGLVEALEKVRKCALVVPSIFPDRPPSVSWIVSELTKILPEMDAALTAIKEQPHD